MAVKKKAATLPNIKKITEKDAKEIVTRKSKMTDLVKSSLTDQLPNDADDHPTEVTAVEQTAALPPATKKPGAVKTATTTPAKGGKLDLDDALKDLAVRKSAVPPSADLARLFK